MRFTNKFGKSCGFYFGDIIIDQREIQENVYTVINAKWIGTEGRGFWEIVLEDTNGQEVSKHSSDYLRKVGSIYV